MATTFLMMSSGAEECSVLVLLDLSAAFDAVDHCIMVNRLRQWVSVIGSTLEWFLSYLAEQSFSVSWSLSIWICCLSCGMPQGSVLGPILFTLYMLLLCTLLSKITGMSCHCYMDNIV